MTKKTATQRRQAKVALSAMVKDFISTEGAAATKLYKGLQASTREISAAELATAVKAFETVAKVASEHYDATREMIRAELAELEAGEDLGTEFEAQAGELIAIKTRAELALDSIPGYTAGKKASTAYTADAVTDVVVEGLQSILTTLREMSEGDVVEIDENGVASSDKEAAEKEASDKEAAEKEAAEDPVTAALAEMGASSGEEIVASADPYAGKSGTDLLKDKAIEHHTKDPTKGKEGPQKDRKATVIEMRRRKASSERETPSQDDLLNQIAQSITG